MGLAHIRLDKLNARTAIPSLDGLHFTLDFTAQGKTPVPETLASGLTTLTVTLESGTWDLEVKGYSDSEILTVRGKSSITITAGISSNVNVYLTPDFSEGGTGKLSYSVEFPGTVSQAFLALYPLDVPGTKESPGTSQEIDISKSAKGTEDIPAGTYQALIDLYDDENNKAAVWTGVVHIYDGSTTSLAKTLTDAHFAACPQVVEVSENTLAAKLDAALASPTGSYTIVLDGTKTDLTEFMPQPLSVTDGKKIAITIRGSGKTVQVDATTPLPLFTLGDGLTLAIQDLTLKGRTSNSVPVVRVNSGGTLVMKAGSRITGNTSSSDIGGVYINDGTFTMNGGAVSGNSAYISGGVYINGGTFTMSGGAVSDNSSTSSGGNGGGGVVVVSQGTFKMNGGEVRGNKSNAYGGGVFASTNAVFTMSGGAVSGNSVSGRKEGGGVHLNSATFMMSGGGVSGNSAGSGGGGGVFVSTGGIFNMSGGEVRANTASKGGGVYLAGKSFTMSGGVIYGSEAGGGKANTANDGKSAAIYNDGDSVEPDDLVTDGMRDTTIDMR
jgi:hypothetical protein